MHKGPGRPCNQIRSARRMGGSTLVCTPFEPSDEAKHCHLEANVMLPSDAKSGSQLPSGEQCSLCSERNCVCDSKADPYGKLGYKTQGNTNESLLLPQWMWFAPMMYLGSWLMFAILAPIFFTEWWLKFYVCFHVTLVLTSIPGQAGTYVYIYRFFCPDKPPEVASTPSSLHYAFIIPAYKEETHVLRETMEILATHRAAKSKYIVMLAMEVGHYA